MTCFNGQVNLPTQCDDTREKVCVENYTHINPTTKFYNANCKANLWQACYSQTTQTSCEDINVRDCKWDTDNIGYSFLTQLPTYLINTSASGICVPNYQPGFIRDMGDPKVAAGCGMASTACNVKMMKRGFGLKGWECETPGLNNLWWNGNNC